MTGTESKGRRAWKHTLALLWYVLIAVILGQIGSLSYVLDHWIDTGEPWSWLTAQARTGQLISSSTALLASSLYFVVRDYIMQEKPEGRLWKAFLLLLSVILGGGGVFMTYKLSAGTVFTAATSALHWWIYWLSIAMAILWWLTEELMPTAMGVIQDVSESAGDMTKRSTEASAHAGVKL